MIVRGDEDRFAPDTSRKRKHLVNHTPVVKPRIGYAAILRITRPSRKISMWITNPTFNASRRQGMYNPESRKAGTQNYDRMLFEAALHERILI